MRTTPSCSSGQFSEALGARTLIMGIVNVTPDSFYDGGKCATTEAALAHGKALVEAGADILDIGGESSRPGADPVPPAVELQRVLPVIEGLAELGAMISVDTYHAETARQAIACGAAMVNDITAFQGDPDMAAVVAHAGCACVLMHMQGTPRTMQRDPRYGDVVEDICRFFDERLAFARSAGVAEETLWIDPGFGFGKTVQHNLTLLARLNEFRRFGRPILIGTSNKSTIGAVLDTPVDDRAEGTAASVALAIANGADAVRVHDVRAMGRVARMADAVVRQGQGNS